MKINCSFDLRQEKLNRKIICWAVRLCEGLNRVRWAALFPVWIGQESKIPTPLNGLSWILASDIKLLTVTLYSNAFPLYSFVLSLSQGIFSIFKLSDHSAVFITLEEGYNSSVKSAKEIIHAWGKQNWSQDWLDHHAWVSLVQQNFQRW